MFLILLSTYSKVNQTLRVDIIHSFLMAVSKVDKSLRIELDHVQDDLEDEKAYELYVSSHMSIPQTNMNFHGYNNILIRDAREYGFDKFSLDEQGFQFIPYQVQDSLSIEAIRSENADEVVREYLQAVKQFLKSKLNAEKVILYDWRIRSTTSSVGLPRPADRRVELTPAQWVHADESGRGGLKVMMEHLTTDEQVELASRNGRFRIMNIWRPLVPIVYDRPLALCDWRSVSQADWELCDQVHDDRVDEAMYLKHRDGHKWWWLPEQSRDELALFVVWDSSKFGTGVQASTPHGAFHIRRGESGPERHSIEVRSIIWTKD
ncbi:hypothetical protein F5Y07DRAFT_383618 [Xylaria sp. FL0933]|nr:hypothetical protein F5Y07DRAFT_383618 [Xylaria sp. FL0933]